MDNEIYQLELPKEIKEEIEKYSKEAEMTFDEFLQASINIGLAVASGEVVLFNADEIADYNNSCNCHDDDDDCCGGSSGCSCGS